MEPSSTISTPPSQPSAAPDYSISAAFDRLKEELDASNITFDDLLKELWENVWEGGNDSMLLKQGVWLVHVPNLTEGQYVVGRFTDSDKTTVVFRPETNVDTSQLEEFRWKADGKPAGWYHADILTHKPPQTFFDKFRSVIQRHNITVLGIGPDPLEVNLPSGQAFVWEPDREVDERALRVTVRQRAPSGHIPARWNFEGLGSRMQSNGQILDANFCQRQTNTDQGLLFICRDCHTNGN